MNEHNRGVMTLPYVVLATFMFSALGIAGNHFNLPLFFSVNFVFGSIAAFIALITLGLVPALIVSAVTGLFTWQLWGHPYAALLLFAEILFVGLLRKRVPVFAYSDLLFWLIAGIPMIFLISWYALKMDTASIYLISLKQPINGIFNAILAPLIVTLVSLFLGSKTWQISARQLVSSTLMLMTIIAGGIPIVFNNYSTQSMQENNLIKLMTNYGNAVVKELQHSRYRGSSSTDKMTENAEYIALRQLELTDLSVAVTFTEPARRLQIGWTRQYSGIGNFQPVQNNLKIWKPIGDMPEMKRWLSSEYFLHLSPETDLGIEEILVTHAAKPLVEALNSQRFQTLASLIILVLFALLTSHFLSQLLIVPIKRLSLASNLLRNSEASGKRIEFPRSKIREFDELAQSMQQSNDVIFEHVFALKNMRDSLETRVEERTSELRLLSAVASQTSNGVIITNLNGITEWVNDGILRMTGYGADDFLGMTPGEVLQGPETCGKSLKKIDDAMKEGRAINVQILNYKRSGEEIWFAMSCNPMTDADGNVSGVIAIAQDVTERRHDQQKLVEARKEADRSNLAKSQFLSTISHEIRTPLNGIMGMVQLLANSKMKPQQHAQLDTILNSSDTLLAIINDVLDMSKIEAGALKIENTSFDLQHLVSTTLTPFQTLAENKYLDLRLWTLPDHTHDLIGDPVRIRQILWNLVSNAIKFTDAGSVDISLIMASSAAIQERGYDTEVTLEVTDSGDGISPDRLADIFEPFTQEDSTVSRKFGGTGLGLSIARQLVELMDGTISVRSDVGIGASFILTIPFNYAQEETLLSSLLPTQQQEASHKRGLKVLVADDNVINATIAKAFLEDLQCVVSVVENGQLAVDAVGKSEFDLIFMDIHMPEMDGIQATQKIRKIKSADELPIVALTADAFEDSKRKFENAGMNSVLTKPFTDTQLKTVLSEFFPQNGKNIIQLKSRSRHNTFRPVDMPSESSRHSQIPIGDDGKFDNLRDFLGEEAIHPMLKVAPSGFRKNLDAIQTALADSKPDAIAEASHAIKGSAAALYALRLAEQAAFLQCNADKLYQVETVLPVLTSTIEDTIQWLQQK